MTPRACAAAAVSHAVICACLALGCDKAEPPQGAAPAPSPAPTTSATEPSPSVSTAPPAPAPTAESKSAPARTPRHPSLAAGPPTATQRRTVDDLVAPLPVPAATAAPPPPDPKEEAVQRLLNELKDGAYALSVPPAMNIDDKGEVVVRVSYHDTPKLTAGLPDAGLQTKATKVGPVMAAALKSPDDLTITSESGSDVQVVDDEDGGEWKWWITAGSAGQKHLFVTLSVVYGKISKPYLEKTETLPVSITVVQRAKRFASAHWTALLGGVLAPPPLVLGALAFLRRRREGDDGRIDD